jgi:hypothetical protein
MWKYSIFIGCLICLIYSSPRLRNFTIAFPFLIVFLYPNRPPVYNYVFVHNRSPVYYCSLIHTVLDNHNVIYHTWRLFLRTDIDQIRIYARTPKRNNIVLQQNIVEYDYQIESFYKIRRIMKRSNRLIAYLRLYGIH